MNVVKDLSHGEKNGKETGKTLNIVVKNAADKNSYSLVYKQFKSVRQ